MKGKRWFAGMVVCLAVLLASAAVAQMDPGPFHILHKQGAIYNSNTGWNLSTPPYYPGSDWAVDFVYNSQGVSILHRDGAVWNSDTGWNLNTPPYFAGTAYARALEYLRDVTGCWGMQMTQFETHLDGTVGAYVLDRDLIEYPYVYFEVEWQTGTRFGGTMVYYDGEECDDEILFEGTIIGDHFTAVAHNLEGEAGVDQCEVLDIITGLVFWNDAETRWEVKGSIVGADVECDATNEAGFFGAFIAWPETICECPPPE